MLPTTLPTSPYIESREGGYYLAGSRIGLDVLTHSFRKGRSAEDIFRAFPSVGSLAKVYGAIAFILEYPQQVEAYLRDRERAYEEFQAARPLTPAMLEPFQRATNLPVALPPVVSA